MPAYVLCGAIATRAVLTGFGGIATTRQLESESRSVRTKQLLFDLVQLPCRPKTIRQDVRDGGLVSMAIFIDFGGTIGIPVNLCRVAPRSLSVQISVRVLLHTIYSTMGPPRSASACLPKDFRRLLSSSGLTNEYLFHLDKS